MHSENFQTKVVQSKRLVVGYVVWLTLMKGMVFAQGARFLYLVKVRIANELKYRNTPIETYHKQGYRAYKEQ